MACHPRPPALWSRCLCALLLSSALLLGVLCGSSEAQITLDGSLGPRGPLQGPNYRIGTELGQIRGSNLFHSFGQFSVPTGGSATFAGPNTIANIVNRVTGGQQSVIDGLLRSEILGANFYLLNPSGVLFGPNASLDVSGSFHVSTADFLRFADGAKFSANLGQESVLTVASPAAFGFLGSNPAGITIQGSSLKVSEEKALSVVGGDMTILGNNGPLTNDSVPTLGAPSGRIQLASVASPGEVAFSPLELAPDLQVDSFARLGRIALTHGALLDVRGNGGGTVLVRGGHLRMDGAAVFTDNLGPVDGVGLGVDLWIAGDAIITNESFITTQSFEAGRARDLQLRVGTLMLTGDSRIVSNTEGPGSGGELTVTATEAVAIAGNNSGLLSNTYGSGDAGRLVVSAPLLTVNRGGIQAVASKGSRGHAGAVEVRVERLTLTEGAQISSFTREPGRGGQLTVTATEAVTIAGRRGPFRSGLFSSTLGSGNAGRLIVSAPTLRLLDAGIISAATLGEGLGGDIDVQVERLTLTGGGQIFTGVGAVVFTNGVPTFSGIENSGRGGTLTVTATESILIAGRDDTGLPSGLASAALVGKGQSGHLLVSTPTLDMHNGGRIEAGTFSASSGHAGNIDVQVGQLTLTGGAQIASSTLGEGRGGQLVVTATEAVAIAGGDSESRPSGLFSASEGRGPGGDLQVAARHAELSSGGTISASSAGDGPAGTILLQAGETFRSQRGAVTTEAAEAGGGRIVLRAGRLVQLIDSELTTTVRGGGGNAGNLTLDAPFVVADGSAIVANAFGGRGGNIRINAEVFLADPASLVSASSALGIQGTVNIQAPVTSLSGTLAPLPQAVVSAAALLPARCVARLSGGTYSSLVLSGRDGLPAEPSGVLPSPLALDERLVADPTVTGAPHRQKSAARFALLAGHEKGLPRLGCPP